MTAQPSPPPQRPAPPVPPAPPPRQRPVTPPAPAPAPVVSATPISLGKSTATPGIRLGIYGPGGVGKTSLALTAPGPVAFIDADGSLPALRPDALQVLGVNDWDTLRSALNAPIWQDVRTIVLDSMTVIEEWAMHNVIATVPHEKGNKIRKIEDYGFGKGYQHIYEHMLALMSDLECHRAAGRNVICICHDCVSTVPNPLGADWQRYEPRLQSPASGKASVRLRLKEWLDFLLFLGFDVTVDDQGKATGHGTRSIYTVEKPFCMAKRRCSPNGHELDDSYFYEHGDASLLNNMLRG